MAKKTQKAKRRIYDRNYYKAQAMLRNPWFKKKAAWLKRRFEEVGHPLPSKPFKKYSEYLKWNEGFWDRYSEMERSPEFLAKKERITSGKKRISVEEYDALEAFKAEYLPPIYGQVFREIKEHFGIDPRDRGFGDFLEYYFFFGRTEYPTSPVGITWKRNPKTNKMELFIRIYGHTKKEDVMGIWPIIAEEQKRCEDYVGKSKEWKTFERDLEIYNTYKEFREPPGKRRTNWVSVDKDVWGPMHKKYPKLTVGTIRNIVSRTRKRLGEI